MKLYETIFIVRQDASTSQVESLAHQFAGILSQNGGSVLNTEFCGLRSLAYRIKKNRKGHYVLMDIASPAPALHEMERQIRLNEDVIRLLTVSVDKHGPRPSALMQSKYAREDNRYDDAGGFSRGDDDAAPARNEASETAISGDEA